MIYLHLIRSDFKNGPCIRRLIVRIFHAGSLHFKGNLLYNFQASINHASRCFIHLVGYTL